MWLPRGVGCLRSVTAALVCCQQMSLRAWRWSSVSFCQNAVEHGLAHNSGEVRVVPSRLNGRLRVEISDNGRGCRWTLTGVRSRSLGLSIVNTLVAEMEGSFELGPRQAGPGTKAVVEIPSRRKDDCSRNRSSRRASWSVDFAPPHRFAEPDPNRPQCGGGMSSVALLSSCLLPASPSQPPVLPLVLLVQRPAARSSASTRCALRSPTRRSTS